MTNQTVRTYRGRFFCPRCGKDGGWHTYPENTSGIKCGDCLMNDCEVVDMHAEDVELVS